MCSRVVPLYMRVTCVLELFLSTEKGWGYVGICSAFARELWPQGWGYSKQLVQGMICGLFK